MKSAQDLSFVLGRGEVADEEIKKKWSLIITSGGLFRDDLSLQERNIFSISEKGGRLWVAPPYKHMGDCCSLCGVDKAYACRISSVFAPDSSRKPYHFDLERQPYEISVILGSFRPSLPGGVCLKAIAGSWNGNRYREKSSCKSLWEVYLCAHCQHFAEEQNITGHDYHSMLSCLKKIAETPSQESEGKSTLEAWRNETTYEPRLIKIEVQVTYSVQKEYWKLVKTSEDILIWEEQQKDPWVCLDQSGPLY